MGLENYILRCVIKFFFIKWGYLFNPGIKVYNQGLCSGQVRSGQVRLGQVRLGYRGITSDPCPTRAANENQKEFKNVSFVSFLKIMKIIYIMLSLFSNKYITSGYTCSDGESLKNINSKLFFKAKKSVFEYLAMMQSRIDTAR